MIVCERVWESELMGTAAVSKFGEKKKKNENVYFKSVYI